MDNEIKVSKQRLVEALTANRDKHKETVALAQEGYRAKLIEELDRRLADAKAGKRVDHGFMALLPVPRDYTAEYDRALQQLEWTLDDELMISDHDFRQLVLDDWGWQREFIASNSAYTQIR